MFKFFRVYNKIILVVGGVVLMVAFLIPQAVTMFSPDPRKEAVGTMHGEEVTVGDVQNAVGELQLLGGLFGGALLPEDETSWLMIQADARQIGLWASDTEVEIALESAGLPAQELTQWVRQHGGLTVGGLQNAVRRLLIAEQYRQLVSGSAYRDPQGKSPSLALARLQTIMQYMSAAQNQPPQVQQMYYLMGMAEAEGTHRLSGPMLKHLVQDNYARIGGQLALVQPNPQSVDEPTVAELERVFAAYKDDLPGTGEPFPFGYKVPSRVKVEYLQVPREAVREKVEVSYIDILDAYRNSGERFLIDGKKPERPTADAVDLLRTELTDQRARQLMQRVEAQVQSLLAENIRGLDEVSGYLELPGGYEPLPLAEVANRVRETLGVELRVLGNPDSWVNVSDLSSLDGIGFSGFGDGQPVFFADLVAQTRALADDPQAVPRTLRTQLNVAGPPLSGFDGGAYYFRLLEAQPSHPPATLDDVQPQVVQDARTIAAYEKLIDEQGQWRQRVLDEGFESVANAEGVLSVEAPPFQKVAGTQGQAPNLPRIGQSRALVDAAFGLIEDRAAGDMPTEGEAIKALPVAERLVVEPVPDANDGPALALFLLESYAPLTRSGYESQLRGGAVVAVSSLLDVGDGEGPLDPLLNPMSKESLAQRVGFTLDDEEDNGR